MIRRCITDKRRHTDTGAYDIQAMLEGWLPDTKRGVVRVNIIHDAPSPFLINTPPTPKLANCKATLGRYYYYYTTTTVTARPHPAHG